MPTTHAFRLTSPKAGSFIQSAANEWTAADSSVYNTLENERARQPLDHISEQLWAALNRKRQRCKTSAALPSTAAAPTVIDGAKLPALLADLPPAKDEFLTGPKASLAPATRLKKTE